MRDSLFLVKAIFVYLLWLNPCFASQQSDGPYISLVYATEYLGHAASSFGHVFIVLHESNMPQLNSEVLQFIAKPTESSRGLTYAFKGLTGGFQGQFEVVPLFMKIREYSELDNRQLIFFPLLLSDDQRNLFFARVKELRHEKKSYYFTTTNCASEINSLLWWTRDRFRDQPKRLITLPSDVIHDHASLFGLPALFPSLKSQIQNAKHGPSREAKKARFDFFKRGKDVADYSKIQKLESENVKFSEKFTPADPKNLPRHFLGTSSFEIALDLNQDNYLITYTPLLSRAQEFSFIRQQFSSIEALQWQVAWSRRERKSHIFLNLLHLEQLPLFELDYPEVSYRLQSQFGENTTRQLFQLGLNFEIIDQKLALAGLIGFKHLTSHEVRPLASFIANLELSHLISLRSELTYSENHWHDSSSVNFFLGQNQIKLEHVAELDQNRISYSIRF